MQKRKLGNSNLESIKIRVLVGRRIRKPDASSKNARSFNPGIPAQMRLEHPLFYALPGLGFGEQRNRKPV